MGMGQVHMTRMTDGDTGLPGQSTFNIDEFDLNDSDREDFDNRVDILFVLDQSASMGSYIEQSKKTICKIVEKFKKKEYDLKLSLCTYIDHPPQHQDLLTDFTDLCSGKQIVEKLQKVYAIGGGDGPEAVMDGLRDGLTKTSWRNAIGKDEKSQRFLFHICDAPPHGQEYGGQSSDPEWQKNGCPCGTKREHIKELLEQHDVQYFLIKPNSQVDKMEQLFKECFGKYYKDTISLQDKVKVEQTTEDGKTATKEVRPEMWEGILSNIEKNVS